MNEHFEKDDDEDGEDGDKGPSGGGPTRPGGATMMMSNIITMPSDDPEDNDVIDE